MMDQRRIVDRGDVEIWRHLYLRDFATHYALAVHNLRGCKKIREKRRRVDWRDAMNWSDA